MAGYRPVYTIDEDTFILKFIIETEGYYLIRGKSFWEDMANSGLIDRTWQSLKERFEKHILPKINSTRYDISNVEKTNIRLGHYQLGLNYEDSDEEDEDKNSDSDS